MTSPDKSQTVILLHGLARSSRAMFMLERSLMQKYMVVNLSYPSRQHNIEKLADIAMKAALAKCEPNSEIHFVTHSLGGILVREFLSKNEVTNLGKVVMLGPPNKGSELVDIFSRISLFRRINGPAGGQLGTTADSKPNSLGPVNFKLGVIAGNRSFSPAYSMFIKGKDDGKVSVESTQVQGMTDHITLPVNHTFMMLSPKVLHQVKHFLENGLFDHAEEPIIKKP